MQVVRRHPIHGQTMALNRAYWALPGIKGTVWEHYMLVASQWPTIPAPPSPQNDGGYFPGQPLSADAPRENYQSADAPRENLVNTTIEPISRMRRQAACPATRACPTRSAMTSSACWAAFGSARVTRRVAQALILKSAVAASRRLRPLILEERRRRVSKDGPAPASLAPWSALRHGGRAAGSGRGRVGKRLDRIAALERPSPRAATPD